VDDETADRTLTFERAMRDAYARAKREAGYNAMTLLRMLTEQGGLATAQTLLRNTATSEGFTALWQKRRLDLSVEALVLRDEFAPLFTDEELDTARHRLTEFGVTI
jgi:hypothetical protein